MKLLRKISFWIFYAFFLLMVAFISGEVFLRFFWKDYNRYLIWPPYYEAVFHADNESTPGVTGPGYFKINSMGLRADELPSDAQQKILVLGGSTAIDMYLDQTETWASRFEQKLNHIPHYPKTWVGNCGKSSLASMHNIMHYKYAFPNLPHADLVVVLIGVNDLQLALRTSYMRNMTYFQHLTWAFSYIPGTAYSTHASGTLPPWWQKLAWFRFYKKWEEYRAKIRQGPVMKTDARGYLAWRKARQEATQFIDELPKDFEESLVQYQKNLNELIDCAHQYGSPIVFLTQSTLWKENMDEPEKKLLLAGGIGPNGEWVEKKIYYTTRILAQGIARFNEMTRQVCKERGVHCIDLEELLPKKADYFYDDMHLNETGADYVASILVKDEYIRNLKYKKDQR